MMRQIFALVLTALFAIPVCAEDLEAEFDNLPAKGSNKVVKSKPAPGRRRLGEMRTTKDRWDELQSDNALQNDDERRQAAVPRAPSATQRRRAASTAVNSRAPASVPNALPSAAPQAHIFPVANFTFEQYLFENARNPAIDRRISDHQVAFVDPAPKAVLTSPDATASSSTTGTPGANPVNGANAGAVQAAAAAAAAAGLIPAANSSTTPNSSGSSSNENQGPIR